MIPSELYDEEKLTKTAAKAVEKTNATTIAQRIGPEAAFSEQRSTIEF